MTAFKCNKIFFVAVLGFIYPGFQFSVFQIYAVTHDKVEVNENVGAKSNENDAITKFNSSMSLQKQCLPLLRITQRTALFSVFIQTSFLV